MPLSDEERKLLLQYQAIPNSMLSLTNRLAVEILPPIIFVAIGLYKGKVIWFIALISLMVIYNVLRVLRQYKIMAALCSISKKIVGSASEEPAADDVGNGS